MRYLYFSALIFILLIASLLIAEVGLRAFKINPYGYQTKGHSISSKPRPLFIPNEQLGYVYNEGEFLVNLNDKLNYNIEILENGERFNPFQTDSCNWQMNVYGCSFFAGMGVCDSQVLSAAISKIDQRWCVSNFSIPGHGLTTQFLLFKEHLTGGQKPEAAVFSIASFHLPRNVGSFVYLRSFGNIRNAPISYPRVLLSADGKVMITSTGIIPGNEFLAKNSALFTQFLVKRDDQLMPIDHQLNVFNILCDSIKHYADQYNVKALFHLITDDPTSKQLLDILKRKNRSIVVSKVDYNNEEMNLMPADGHPNEHAHKIYATEIIEYFAKHN